MGFEVVFTLKSEKDFDTIFAYIQKDFGATATNQFEKLILNLVELLEISPELGSIEIKSKNIRCFVIHKRLKVFYRIKSRRVIILRLFDTRQKPISFK